jgi:hypothetical protein
MFAARGTEATIHSTFERSGIPTDSGILRFCDIDDSRTYCLPAGKPKRCPVEKHDVDSFARAALAFRSRSNRNASPSPADSGTRPTMSSIQTGALRPPEPKKSIFFCQENREFNLRSLILLN